MTATMTLAVDCKIVSVITAIALTELASYCLELDLWMGSEDDDSNLL